MQREKKAVSSFLLTKQGKEKGRNYTEKRRQVRDDPVPGERSCLF